MANEDAGVAPGVTPGASDGDSSDAAAAFSAASAAVNALKAVVDERDRRYEQRFQLQDAATATAFAAAEKAVTAALAAAEKAVTKAELAAEKRFEAVNEFRGQLADQANTLMSRNEYQVAHDALVDKVLSLGTRLDRIESSEGASKQAGQRFYAGLIAAITLLVAAAGIAVAVLAR